MGKLRLRVYAGAVALAVGSGAFAVQAATDDQSTGLWFIELNSSIDAFRAQARAAGVEHNERHVYTRIWKGLSVQSTADGASRLARLQSVRAVFPVLTVTIGPMEAASPELSHALAMTGADVAQNELGLTGEGVKVAVIDTGIDYHHPDLGGGFGPGSRVVTGYDFVGDRFDSSSSGGALRAHPDRDPDDCNGHGTHVAGIIGANGNPATGGALGVAPGVTFGAYRVFGCTGSTTADIMLAAMERALADGMNVVNMSIGSAFQTWPQYPTAVAADALVDGGVVVVVSAGNAGASGVYSASAPGVGRKVIGVASFDNSHLEMPFFEASPDARPFGYIQAAAAPAAPTTGTTPLAGTGTPTTGNDACAALPPGSLTGKIALIRRGTCSFYAKSRNAEIAGAAGIVLYNNVAGFILPTVAPPAAGDPPVTIPVVAILAEDGVELNNRIAAGETTLTWTEETAIFSNPTSGTSSSFTAFGLDAELQLKPNIGAPGGLIRSTWPLENGGYATISGTSMSSPHVAGAAALFLDKHPGASPAAVKTALQNSADPVVIFGTTPSVRDAAHRQGAGMVDIDDALMATTTVTPSELSLGEGTAAQTKPITITNNSAAAVTYTVAHQSAAGTRGSTFAPILTTNPMNTPTVIFDATNVTVPPGGSATVTVTITPTLSGIGPTGAVISFDRSVYTGYIVVSGGGSTYRVPYAGFTGDYQTIRVLAAGGCALSPFPGIFKLGGETVCVAATPTAAAVKLDVPVTRQAEGATFNVEDRNDRPVILYQRAHQSRRLEIRAIEVTTGQSHLVAFADYLSRNATNQPSLVNGGFSTFTWDGKRLFTNSAGLVRRQALPAGAYKLQLVVTKALAEAGNAAHIETWESPMINITRN